MSDSTGSLDGAGDATRRDPAAAAHPDDDARQSAALYALDALPADERRAFEAHIASCPACAREARAFLETAAMLGRAAAVDRRPPAGLRERLLERVAAERAGTAAPAPEDHAHPREAQVWKTWRPAGGSDLAPGLSTVRAGEGTWESTAVPGVEVKPLFVDPVRHYVTMLVRMAAGTSYPSHRHAGAEECFVLEGDLHVAGRALRAGDYQRADAESLHGVQSTEKGCLLLIVSSQDDELI